MTKPAPRLSAQVFLRSVSGESLRALGQEPLPEDLTPFLPSEGARREAVRALADLGFETHPDAMGMTISIEGPPALFRRVFAVPAARLRVPSAAKTVSLPPPSSLRHLVEAIVLTPKPEFYPRSGA